VLHIGIDLGTTGIKAVLFEDLARVVASAAETVAVSRPRVGWSEQDPDGWVAAVVACLDRLAAEAPAEMAAVRGIGLSGQMLSALILDAALRPIRPAMLWNDQRALAECAELLALVPDIGERTNGTPDPGITAPKLMWLARHEPEAMARARMLLLTKDYVRLALTGEVASEPSDAGGTQLFDCRRGAWDPALCAAAGWDAAHLPPVLDSWAEAGRLRPEWRARWGMAAPVPVAAGAGDNMGSTLGAGGAAPGDGVLTIGTSGVSCVVDRAFHPGPQKAILTSAHVVPGRFLSMGVVMSATASLDWVARLTGQSAAALDALAEDFVAGGEPERAPLFLPCLTGVRTPLNRPDLLGRMAGLHPGVTPGMLAFATMEGVATQVADCLAAQRAVGVETGAITLVGGGTRSRLWVRLIATALGTEVGLAARSHIAGPLGAARLAAVAAGAPVAELSRPVEIGTRIGPDPSLAPVLEARRAGLAALLAG
jgi:xylulokinase